MTDSPDWRYISPSDATGVRYEAIDPVIVTGRYTTAPYNAETAISLLSAVVGTLNGLTLTDAEKERVRSILERLT